MKELSNVTVTEIRLAGHVISPKGRYEEQTNRPCYGLSFCLEGQITYTHQGRETVSDPSCAIILPKGQSYTIRGDRDGVFPVINFDCKERLCDGFVAIPIPSADFLVWGYEQMKNLLLFDGNRAEIFSIFYHMIHKLSSENRQAPDALLPAMDYLEAHCFSPSLTNAALASQCNISEVYFRKLFTKTYGRTPRQFIIDARINKAKQLLTDGALKINAIAEQCGFSSPYYFCRLFRQKTGMLPSEFMKQNRSYKI